MDRTDPPWTEFKSNAEMQCCILCDKTTKSHGILLTIDTDSDQKRFVTVNDPDDADMLLAVCHTCYRDIDGDADEAAARYTEKLQESPGDFETNYFDMATRAKEDVEREETITEGDVDTAYETIKGGDIVEINGHGPYIIVEQLTENRNGGFYVMREEGDPGEDDYWLHRSEGEVILKEGAPRMPGPQEVVSKIDYASNAMLRLSELMEDSDEEMANALRRML